MIINHNISSIFSHRQLTLNNLEADKDIEKLSSGMKINRAGDDASGLAVSEKMRSQIRGLRRANQNTLDAISMIQTAEGYLEETAAILQRLRELAVQAANGIYDAQDRMMIQVEVSQMIAEIDRIASHAQFNGLNLLTGRFARFTGENTVVASMWFHVGANMDQRIRAYIGTMNSQGLGLKSPVGNAASASFISLSTPDKANMAIGMIDVALLKVNKQRADLGAYQNRLEKTSAGLMVGFENLQAAESRIRDTDMAEQMALFVKNQILTQAANAMLAQANQKPQMVLQLLR
ncbi:flagellin N-terminal helical domain-containing protein [Thermospira aquatica]|uniref:Flagellin n=1 Tax=Thermospira aquatica TaxID=2828656 RepID=A0AAX3BB42_9SPIR|nr:flagellin [Thermospira aquatica]URA09455.1 flagellin [Thermospira aquatica]